MYKLHPTLSFVNITTLDVVLTLYFLSSFKFFVALIIFIIYFLFDVFLLLLLPVNHCFCPSNLALECTGDRIVSVNGETIVGKSYDQVVSLIQKTRDLLYLEVSPKQYDTLQLVRSSFFVYKQAFFILTL